MCLFNIKKFNVVDILKLNNNNIWISRKPLYHRIDSNKRQIMTFILFEIRFSSTPKFYLGICDLLESRQSLIQFSIEHPKSYNISQWTYRLVYIASSLYCCIYWPICRRYSIHFRFIQIYTSKIDKILLLVKHLVRWLVISNQKHTLLYPEAIFAKTFYSQWHLIGWFIF